MVSVASGVASSVSITVCIPDSSSGPSLLLFVMSHHLVSPWFFL
ncbi:Uncharacterised protein [Mycobacteroides abscessus subsp. abscessus]|nr:Uncharacterised protein [Mycobacteroides abscessus subsp. abscessus]